MAFTAKDVQSLRQATGAGMMDAKKALEANDGDMEAAKQWLREKGLAASAKRDDRENTQGVVALVIDGNVECTVTADSSGNWSCDVLSQVVDGPHQVDVTVHDAAGNLSTTTTIHFQLDTVTPQPPIVITPPDGSSTNKLKPTFSGTGETGTTVTVQVDGNVVCTSTVNAQGNWSCTPAQNLTEATHTLEVSASDVAGNQSAVASSSFTVDTNAPNSPVVTDPANGSSLGGTPVTVAGTADPNVTVTVTLDGAAMCTATSDSAGNWSCSVPNVVPDGLHTLTAKATSQAGTSSSASTSGTCSAKQASPAVAPSRGASPSRAWGAAVVPPRPRKDCRSMVHDASPAPAEFTARTSA